MCYHFPIDLEPNKIGESLTRLSVKKTQNRIPVCVWLLNTATMQITHKLFNAWRTSNLS